MQEAFGFELFLAQTGEHPPSAKILKGIASGAVELVEDFDGDTYRAVYTVRFETAVYVLHCFKKKSNRAIKTPQHGGCARRKPIMARLNKERRQ